VFPSTLLLGVVGVLCFFGFAKGTKNTNNNKESKTTTTARKQQQHDNCMGWLMNFPLFCFSPSSFLAMNCLLFLRVGEYEQYEKRRK
jgi:hypothetical protein